MLTQATKIWLYNIYVSKINGKKAFKKGNYYYKVVAYKEIGKKTYPGYQSYTYSGYYY
ncbi:MAG: hypothetical protein HFH36_05320 [Lachnospiraceae bacterium]|nr:hypothetical protein [Lachnospiraceae bacterium]